MVGKYIAMIKEKEAKSGDYLIKQLPSATAFIDQKLHVVHASDQWITDFDFMHIDIIGKTLFDLFGSVSSSWIASLEACFSGNACTRKREEYLDRDGNKKYVECTSMPWYDSEENILGAILQTTLISPEHQTALDTEKLQLLLDTQSEISKIGSWEYNIATQELFWCQMTKTIHAVPLDYQPSVDRALQFYKEGYSRNTISLALYKAIENGTPWSEKLQIVNNNGEEIWVIAAGKPIVKEGKTVSIIGTFQDINEQVIHDIKTKESEKLLQTLIDNLPVNVYIKDLDSRKILVNKAECNYLGVSHPDQILGKTDFDSYDQTMASTFREEDLTVINSLRPILGKESFIIKNDGTATHCLVSKIPLIGTDGKAYGIVGICMDISELKQKEEELRNLIHVTSLQNKKLINFAHIVSHNLRSHAANFSMLLDFLVEEKNAAEKEKITSMLITASTNLMQTLDNLNEVVAITRNMKSDKTPVNINEKLRLVQRDLSELLQRNNATIVNTIEEGMYVRAIPEYLESILTNFITNAIKYSKPNVPPVIRLSASLEGDYTVLSIQDNGQGIDLKKYGDKLFGMYKTFHGGKDARGIGLYITKNQVEAMNGKIVTQSEVGMGTTFKIYFNECL